VTTAKDVRDQITDALELDLVGPRADHPAHAGYANEVLPTAPSRWYLTGFLVPHAAPEKQRSDDDGDEQLDLLRRAADADDDAAPEKGAARKTFFPSSMGLSILVTRDTERLGVKIAWADYEPLGPPTSANVPDQDGSATASERAARRQWTRIPRSDRRMIDIVPGTRTAELPNYPEMKLVVSVRSVEHHDLVPPGTRSVSVFLVNERRPAPDEVADVAYAFQPQMSVHAPDPTPFVARPDLHGQDSDDPDEQLADLQYRDAVEYAVGHNVAAVADRDRDGECREVRTSWLQRRGCRRS
jgi:hypothetical protein